MAKENRTVVKAFNHIEMSVENAREVADYMIENFGAVEVEHGFSSYLAQAFQCQCIHVMWGGVVYQLVTPHEGMPFWNEQLKSRGNTINNISIQAADGQALVDKLVASGAELVLEFSAEMKQAGFNRDGEDKGWIVDARKQCGLFIEICDYIPEYVPGEQD